MNFLIPRKIQDKLLCKSCHKVLSVQPVKLYKDGMIKCGRCPDYTNDGVISIYNEIAATSIFNCVNRFDGCKQLLISSDVLQHELECLPSISICPLCSEEILLYIMIQHFEDNHKSSFIKSHNFEIKEFMQLNGYFLYRLKDNLFFIFLQNWIVTNESLEIRFNCMLLGKEKKAGDIIVKFGFNLGDSYQEKKIPCDVYSNSCEGGGSIVTLNSSANSSLFVRIEIQNETDELIRLPMQKRKSSLLGRTSEIKKRKNLNEVFDYEKRSLMFMKTVSINNRDYTTNLDIGVLSDDGKSFYLKDTKRNVNYYCINCLLLPYSWTSDLLKIKNCYTMVDNQYYVICLGCSQVVGQKFKNTITKQYDEILRHLRFFCKWSCGECLDYINIIKHEISCHSQHIRQCPISICTENCREDEFDKHFIEKHSQKFALAYKLLDINLDPKSLHTEYFFLISNAFIQVNFVWEQPYWQITLKCDVEGAEPRLIVLNGKGELLSFVKNTEKVYHQESFLLKCYVVDPQRIFNIF